MTLKNHNVTLKNGNSASAAQKKKVNALAIKILVSALIEIVRFPECSFNSLPQCDLGFFVGC